MIDHIPISQLSTNEIIHMSGVGWPRYYVACGYVCDP